jgi:hypothetical protein
MAGHAQKPELGTHEAGHAIASNDPYESQSEWALRGHVRDSRDAAAHAAIMSLMAGAEAEGLLLGTKLTVGDMYDRKLIDDIAGGHLNCDWSKK